jgi:hypothetical protein
MATVARESHVPAVNDGRRDKAARALQASLPAGGV